MWGSRGGGGGGGGGVREGLRVLNDSATATANYSVAFLTISAKRFCTMCSAEVLFVQHLDLCFACRVCTH